MAQNRRASLSWATSNRWSPTRTKTVHPKEALRSSLEASGRAIAELLRKAVASGGKVKGFKPHASAFLGYLIAHESHHRGQVGWTLKGTGHPLDPKTAFGL